VFIEAPTLHGASNGFDEFFDAVTQADSGVDSRRYTSGRERWQTDGAVGIGAAVTADGAVEDVDALPEKLLRFVRAKHDERAERLGGMNAMFHDYPTLKLPTTVSPSES
jgi:hypothetical protein